MSLAAPIAIDRIKATMHLIRLSFKNLCSRISAPVSPSHSASVTPHPTCHLQLAGGMGAQKYSSIPEDEDVDALGGPADPQRAFKNCPGERVEWPEYRASFLSRWFFMWVGPMLQLGSTVHLEHSDLWKLHPKETTEVSYGKFKKLYDAERTRAAENGTEFKLWRPVFHSVRTTVLQAAVLRLLNSACSLSRPLVMQQILLVIEGDDSAWVTKSQGWVLAILMMSLSFGEFMGYGHYMHLVNKASWRLRESIVALLYVHVTTLSAGARASYSGGKITNLMSSDTDRVRFMTIQVPYSCIPYG